MLSLESSSSASHGGVREETHTQLNLKKFSLDGHAILCGMVCDTIRYDTILYSFQERHSSVASCVSALKQIFEFKYFCVNVNVNVNESINSPFYLTINQSIKQASKDASVKLYFYYTSPQLQNDE